MSSPDNSPQARARALLEEWDHSAGFAIELSWEASELVKELDEGEPARAELLELLSAARSNVRDLERKAATLARENRGNAAGVAGEVLNLLVLLPDGSAALDSMRKMRREIDEEFPPGELLPRAQEYLRAWDDGKIDNIFDVVRDVGILHDLFPRSAPLWPAFDEMYQSFLDEMIEVALIEEE